VRPSPDELLETYKAEIANALERYQKALADLDVRRCAQYAEKHRAGVYSAEALLTRCINARDAIEDEIAVPAP
jgi:sugar-specific transcriptional regulator TrmB